FGLEDEGPEPVIAIAIAIGEAKWNEVMSVTHLDRLRHIRGLLTAQGRPSAAGARLLCFSGARFTEGLDQPASATNRRKCQDFKLYHAPTAWPGPSPTGTRCLYRAKDRRHQTYLITICVCSRTVGLRVFA
ncbi:MAG TPA: hypothetical protein VN961_16485, partial [Streptosporangiaceae bacterium]|nr:hypothetical protein [Streptosporangiaceae bacterium]